MKTFKRILVGNWFMERFLDLQIIQVSTQLEILFWSTTPTPPRDVTEDPKSPLRIDKSVSFPHYLSLPVLLSIMVGTGSQLTAMSLVTLFFALLGFLSPSNRGSLATVMIVAWTLFGALAGYMSARAYASLNGDMWKRNVFGTAVLFPTVIFASVKWVITSDSFRVWPNPVRKLDLNFSYLCSLSFILHSKTTKSSQLLFTSLRILRSSSIRILIGFSSSMVLDQCSFDTLGLIHWNQTWWLEKSSFSLSNSKTNPTKDLVFKNGS